MQPSLTNLGGYLQKKMLSQCLYHLLEDPFLDEIYFTGIKISKYLESALNMEINHIYFFFPELSQLK